MKSTFFETALKWYSENNEWIIADAQIEKVMNNENELRIKLSAALIELSNAIIKNSELTARAKELEEYNTRLTGETFSDRNHTALQSRITQLSESNERLRGVIKSHIVDLRKSSKIVSKVQGFEKTAKEIEKAAQELELALAE